MGRRKNGQHGSLHLFEAMAQRKMAFVKTGPYNISGQVRFGSVRSGAKGPLFARSDRTLTWEIFFFSSNLYLPFCRESVIPF